VRIPAVVRWYEWLKALVFALIALNALIFLIYGTKPEAIDTLAWLTLLVLFELETAHSRLQQDRRVLRIAHLIRFAAGAAICVADCLSRDRNECAARACRGSQHGCPSIAQAVRQVAEPETSGCKLLFERGDEPPEFRFRQHINSRRRLAAAPGFKL